MQQFKLILILASCLVLKATMVAGAEMENSGTENINQVMAMNDELIANPEYALANPYELDWKQIAKYANNDDTTEAESVTDATASVERTVPAPMPVNNNVRVTVQGGDSRNSNSNEYSNKSEYSDKGDVSSVMGTRIAESTTPIRTAITPMIGYSNYYGAWANHVSNLYTLGLGLEVNLNSIISIEVEGGYAKSDVAYLYYKHDFNQYNIGANAKLYLSRSMIQPWIGVGVMGLYYENMSHGPAFAYSSYNQWMGAVQPLAGLDVEVVKGIAVGVRGAYIIPTINKPTTLDNGRYSFPYFEEAGLMNTSYYKAMAQVKVMF